MNTVQARRPSKDLSRTACASSRNLARRSSTGATMRESILSSPNGEHRSLPIKHPSAWICSHCLHAPGWHRGGTERRCATPACTLKCPPWIRPPSISPALSDRQEQTPASRFSLASSKTERTMFLLLNDSVKCGINPTINRKLLDAEPVCAPRSDGSVGSVLPYRADASTKPSEQTRRATSTHTHRVLHCRRCRTPAVFLRPANTPAASR